MRQLQFSLGFMVASLAWASAALAPAADDGKTYKVFIFAGQSNAQGKIDKKTLDLQAEMPQTKSAFEHLRENGQWRVRDDVFATYQNARTGPLTIGFGSAGRTGSELEFGWMMGEHFDEPVVIVKTCQGGMSLTKDFRPPSAELPSDEILEKQLKGAVNRAKAQKQPEPTLDSIKDSYGNYYRYIFSDLRALSNQWDREFPPLKQADMVPWINTKARNWQQDYPALKDRKPELAGIVWFQGWNDQYGSENEYESNMKHFINDLRRDLGAPKLPFVIVAMGQNGSKPAEGAMLTVREAQMAMNDVPDFKGNVKAFRSDLLVDKDTEAAHADRKNNPEEWKKYGSDEAYHYYGSPIWYTRIGHAAGESMLELLKQQGK